MSEYAHHSSRGRMVGLVFSAQAVGLVVGPLTALALLGGGAGPGLTWRLLLGLGAIPAAAAVWLRRTMPEPPRYQAQRARGRGGAARRPGAAELLASRTLLLTLAGTAGCWFLLDYAYYGNTISTPQIIGLISPARLPDARRSPSSSRSSPSPPCPATSWRSRGWTGSGTAGSSSSASS